MFLFLRIIVFALIINTFIAHAEVDVSSQNYTIEFLNMVNNLTQISNHENIKNDTNIEKTQDTKAEIEKIMLVFPNRSFKNKLTPNATTVKPEIKQNQTIKRNTTKVQTTKNLIKPIRPNIKDEKEKLKKLQQLLIEEVLKTYNKTRQIQNTPERKFKVVIRRRKINKISQENTTINENNERHFVRRETYFKYPTQGLQIIGPIPSGFYGLKSPLTTYDGIRKSDLELPNDQNKKMLINTGVISPEFLNLLKQKYDDVLTLYEKAVANYNVYNELYNKAKELGTI